MDFSKDLVPAMYDLFVGSEIGDKRMNPEWVNALGRRLEADD